MPFAVYLPGLAVFAQSTSEFMLSGLVPGIAADLDVSIADAGYLSSAFAVGMIVGAPLLAILARRWPQRAPDAKGRAMSVVTGGVTIARVAGVPGGGARPGVGLALRVLDRGCSPTPRTRSSRGRPSARSPTSRH